MPFSNGKTIAGIATVDTAAVGSSHAGATTDPGAAMADPATSRPAASSSIWMEQRGWTAEYDELRADEPHAPITVDYLI
jgi:hypothetical protein